jgi:hypothetical protein
MGKTCERGPEDVLWDKNMLRVLGATLGSKKEEVDVQIQ